MPGQGFDVNNHPDKPMGRTMRATNLIADVPGFCGAFSFFVHIAGDPNACVTGIDHC